MKGNDMTTDWEFYHYLRTVEHVDHTTAMRYATELEDGEDNPWEEPEDAYCGYDCYGYAIGG